MKIVVIGGTSLIIRQPEEYFSRGNIASEEKCGSPMDMLSHGSVEA